MVTQNETSKKQKHRQKQTPKT